MANPFDIAEADMAGSPSVSQNPFDVAEASLPVAKISGTPVNQPSQLSSGLPASVPPIDNPDYGFLKGVAQDPRGFIKSLPGSAMTVAGAPGTLAYDASADVISKVFGQPEYGGNLAALQAGGDATPAQDFINSAARTNPKTAVAANISKALPELASMFVVNPTGTAGRLVALGFSADMIAGAKPMFEEYAAEINKPVEEQDAGKIAQLKAGILQTFTFAPLAGAHGAGDFGMSAARDRVPRGTGIDSPENANNRILPAPNNMRVTEPSAAAEANPFDVAEQETQAAQPENTTIQDNGINAPQHPLVAKIEDLQAQMEDLKQALTFDPAKQPPSESRAITSEQPASPPAGEPTPSPAAETPKPNPFDSAEAMIQSLKEPEKPVTPKVTEIPPVAETQLPPQEPQRVHPSANVESQPVSNVESQPVSNVGSSPMVDKIAARYREIAPDISEAVARKNAGKLADAIQGNKMHDLLRPDNKISRQIYEETTERKLPRTIVGTRTVAEGRLTAAESARVAKVKPNLMNRPPPGGWTEADKVPEQYRKPSAPVEPSPVPTLEQLKAKLAEQSAGGRPVDDRLAEQVRNLEREQRQPASQPTDKTTDSNGDNAPNAIAKNEQSTAQPTGKATSKPSITDKLDDGDKARLAELQSRLRKKFTNLNTGIDPEIITIGGEMAGLYVKAGVKQFAEFARHVKNDLPDIWDKLKKHLKSIWEATAVNHPDVDEPSRAEVAKHIEGIDTEAKPVQSESDERPMDQRSGSAEAGDAGEAGRSVSEIDNSDRGRMGSDEPTTGETVGSGRDTGGESPSGIGPNRASEPSVSSRPAEQPGEPGAIAKRDQRDLRRSESPPVVSDKNYSITEADALGKGGPKVKVRDNIDAIKLVKLLETENRKPTTLEQAKLVRFVGWGGLKGIFDAKNKNFAKEFQELRDLLTPDEYDSARRSIMDAHYTSPTVIQKGIYAAMQRLGFRGGKMVEGGVGIGNFIGFLPDAFRARTSYLGVEFDPLTAKIAKYLYPEARIIEGSFAEAKLGRGTFDGSVGNPPFGQQKLYDKDFKEESAHSIHNYFIAKELALLRPGGVLAKVVSRYFLDAVDSSAREFIHKQAEFLGAIRLPNTAFKENAGTSVVTDLVFFRKRAEGETPGDDAWTKTAKIDFEGHQYDVSSWIKEHPDMVLGDLGKAKNGMNTEFQLAVEPREGQDLGKDLTGAVEKLPADVYLEHSADTRERLTTPEPREVPEGVKVGNYFENERGELKQRGADDNMTPTAQSVDMPAATAERVRGIIPIRDALNKLVEAERTWDTPEKSIARYRSELNKAYDAFVKDYGYLNSTTNRRAFYADADNNRVLGLESDYQAGISKATAKKNNVAEIKPSATKAAIFSKRVNTPYQEVTHVDTPKEALTVSLNQRGHVDMEHMAQLVNMPEKDVAAALEGLVFKTPAGEWESKEQYVSGDVRAKLQAARDAAISDPSYQKNIAALEPVIPKDIEPLDIQVPLGAGWVPAEDYAAFARELTGSDPGSVTYIRAKGGWVFNHGGSEKWNTKRMSFGDMMEAMMNGKPVQVWDRTSDDKNIINQEETALAKVKADEIKDAFQNWVWTDKDRRDRLARTYNDKFNNYADFRADGSHLTLPGASSLVQLNPHQKNVVWRTMTKGTVLYDHVVGAGKTFAGIASFMEMKRTGQLRKPLFAVPNHLTEQWKTEFYKLYPNANVLAARPSDFTKDNRQKMFSTIMTGDYDAVILGHSALKKIGVSPEVERGLIREMQQEIVDTIREMKAAAGKGGGTRAIAQLERTKESLDAKLKKLADIGGRDDTATFDELGIDGLFVDEAHEFKNLFYTTQMQNVAGLGNPAGSARAFDLYLKTRYLKQRYAGKAPMVFATGTPISNSLVEMFTMQRYLQPDVLERMGLKTLDAWAKVFADVQSVYEVDPTGTGYRMATRLANFQNVGELTAIYKDFADCITMSDLQAQAEAAGKRFPVPKVDGGKPDNIVVKRTPEQEAYFGIETHEMDSEGNPKYDAEGNPVTSYPVGTILHRVDNMPDDPRIDNMLKLTNDARKAGLDMRLNDPNAPDRPDSKVNTSARQIAQIYHDNKANKGTQLVFCDLSVPASAKGKATARATTEPGELFFRKIGDGYEAIPDAKPLDIPEAPDHKFYTYKGTDAWHVVERSTGLSIGKGGNRKVAIEKATRSIEMFGERFKEQVEKQKATPDQLAELKALQEAAAPAAAESDDAPAPEEAQGVTMDELLADGSSFSVYDDLKAKLIKAGIPEKEIAFIHDFDSPEKKAKLFKAMNDGDVRVLMGSTPKLGAGTNVQAKLVALHHLDAPWRPSDLEQREGRIIRQGNKFYQQWMHPEWDGNPDSPLGKPRYKNVQDYDTDPKAFAVKIKRYATGLTYDTRMWQLIEHKAAGIEGFRNADRSTRKIEDVSGEAANASDMKAAASGDPNIQKEIQLRNERAKLELLQKAWARNKIELQNRQAFLRDYDLRYQSAADATAELIKTRDANTKVDADGKREFEFKLPNGTSTDEKGVPVGEMVTAIKSEHRSGYVGKYRGFDISYNVVGDALLLSQGKEFTARKIITSYRTGEEGDKLSGVGLFQRLDNWMGGFDEQEKQAAVRRDQEKKQLAGVQAEASKEFPKTDEYAKIRAEHEQVKSELLNKKKKAAPAPAAPKADIVDRLEAMKDKSPPKIMGAFIPGLDPETFRIVRNAALDVAIASIKAGRAIKEAVEDALDYLRSKYQGLDEDAARTELTAELQKSSARTLGNVKADLADAEEALRNSVRTRPDVSQKAYKQGAAVATARYRTIRDELKVHPERIAEVLKAAAQTSADAKAARDAGDTAKAQLLESEMQGHADDLARLPQKLVSRIQDELIAKGELPGMTELAPNAGRTLQAMTDALKRSESDSPTVSFLDRLNLAKKAADTYAAGKDFTTRALMNSAAASKALWSMFKSAPTSEDFKQVMKNWIGYDTRTSIENANYVKALVAKVPQKLRREAMSVWLDADGDKGLLEFQRQNVPDKYTPLWEAALRLTASEQKFAREIKANFEQKLQDGMNVGIIAKGRQEYGVPQRWKVPPQRDAGDISGEKRGSAGNPYAKLDPRDPFFSFQRETPTYFDGIMGKGEPENLDVAHLVSVYDQSFHKALSSRGAIKAFSESNARDGQPVVKISGRADIRTGENPGVFVDSQSLPKDAVSADGRPYQSVDHWAMRNWKFAAKDNTGNPILVRGDMLVHPDHVDFLKNELNTPRWTTKGAQGIERIGHVGLQASSFLKASKFIGPFHIVTEALHASFHGVVPSVRGFDFDLNDPKQALLSRNMMIDVGRAREMYDDGLRQAGGGIWGHVPGLGDAIVRLNNFTFNEYIPRLKMKVGLAVLERNQARYGGKLTQDQIAEITGRQMDAAFGGQNWRLLGANKSALAVTRLALVAPDFLISRAKVVGQAFRPYNAEQRIFLLAQAAGVYTLARILNSIFSDDHDPHFELKNWDHVVIGKRAYHARFIVSDAANLARDLLGLGSFNQHGIPFITGRMGVLPKMGMEVASGKDLFTGQAKDGLFQAENPLLKAFAIVAKDTAEWMTPMGVDGFLPGSVAKGQTGLGSAVAATVGVSSRRESAASDVWNKAREFNLNSSDPKAVRFQKERDAYTGKPSDYRALDNLLDAGELDKAKAEYKNLLSVGRNPGAIATRYEHAKPFTGNFAREIQFMATLSATDKKLYERAKAEQQARADAFRTMMGR